MTPPIRMASGPFEDLLFYKLKDLILEQSEGEWTEEMIVRDAHHFANHIRPLLTAAPVREEGGAWTLDDMRELVSDEQVRHLVSATDVAQGRIRLRDILNALATREEAPADNVTILITRAQREAAKNSGKKLNDWIGGILQRAVEEAPAEHHERNLAMTNAELIEQALSHPPLEAPAEAGEDVELIAALRSMPRCHCAGDDWPSLYDRAADRLEALRAQPQAREEGQPMADAVEPIEQAITTLKGHIAAIQAGKQDGGSSTLITDCINGLPEIVRWIEIGLFNVEAAFEQYEDTPPAPEAEKLRVAVEALKPFSMAFRSLSSRWEDHETHWHEATSAISVGDLYRADTALAALQQDALSAAPGEAGE